MWAGSHQLIIYCIATLLDMIIRFCVLPSVDGYT